MPRPLLTLVAPALAALIAAPAFGEAGQQPPPPQPQPQSIPIQFTPPKSNVTIRVVGLDTAGAVTPEGQKVLDEMIEEGWRAIGISTVSSEQPVKMAVMFSRTVKAPPPQGQPPQIGLPPQQQPGQQPFHQGPPPGRPAPQPQGQAPQAPPPPPEHNP